MSHKKSKKSKKHIKVRDLKPTKDAKGGSWSFGQTQTAKPTGTSTTGTSPTGTSPSGTDAGGY